MKRPDIQHTADEMKQLAKYVRSRADRHLRGSFQSIAVEFQDGLRPRFKITGYRQMGCHMGIGKTIDEAMDDMLGRIERMPDIDAILGLEVKA